MNVRDNDTGCALCSLLSTRGAPLSLAIFPSVTTVSAAHRHDSPLWLLLSGMSKSGAPRFLASNVVAPIESRFDGQKIRGDRRERQGMGGSGKESPWHPPPTELPCFIRPKTHLRESGVHVGNRKKENKDSRLLAAKVHKKLSGRRTSTAMSGITPDAGICGQRCLNGPSPVCGACG